MSKTPVYIWRNLEDISGGVEFFLNEVKNDFSSNSVGFKIHFGEAGNTTHINPNWLKCIPDIFSDPSFVECNVLYKGSRTTRSQHLEVVKQHGFDFIPVDILDGERGEQEIEVYVGSKDTDRARLGKGILNYEYLVALSHFKGHMATGFGGALKNVGMGLGSRAGKLDMHSLIAPYIVEDKCVACGICAKHCPADAITIGDKASIDKDKCIGCVHCISYCPHGACEIPWNLSNEINNTLMRKIVDYSKAAFLGRRWGFINFLMDVTYDCDCLGFKQEPIIPDVGILYSDDPVALDCASMDLVVKSFGRDPFEQKHDVSGYYILDYCEKQGLGNRDYRLIEV